MLTKHASKRDRDQKLHLCSRVRQRVAGGGVDEEIGETLRTIKRAQIGEKKTSWQQTEAGRRDCYVRKDRKGKNTKPSWPWRRNSIRQIHPPQNGSDPRKNHSKKKCAPPGLLKKKGFEERVSKGGNPVERGKLETKRKNVAHFWGIIVG